jgi:hypothetical protein
VQDDVVALRVVLAPDLVRDLFLVLVAAGAGVLGGAGLIPFGDAAGAAPGVDWICGKVPANAWRRRSVAVPGSRRDSVAVESLLDAMEGIAYLVDRHGVIAAVGREGWRSFAQDNDTPALAEAAAVVGRPLLSFIKGEAVRRAYEGYLEALRSGRRRALSFEFSCDSPTLARRMRLCISTVTEGIAPAGFLFQSLLLEERTRPPVSLFDAKIIAAALQEKGNLPLLTMCSYCQRVADEAEEGRREWVAAETYYRRGGSSAVRISHGICPSCMKERVEPLLA